MNEIEVTYKNGAMVSVTNINGYHGYICPDVTGAVKFAEVVSGAKNSVEHSIQCSLNNGKINEDKDDWLGDQSYATPVRMQDLLINEVQYDSIVVVLYNWDIVKRLVDEGWHEEDIIFITDKVLIKGAYLEEKGIYGVRCIGCDRKNPESVGRELRKALTSMNPKSKKIEIVSNPPYKGYIPIFRQVLPQCDRAFFIYPSTHLFTHKPKSYFNIFNKEFGKNIKQVTLVDGKKDFGINVFYSLTITEFDMHKKEDGFDIVDKTTANGKDEIYHTDCVDNMTWMGKKFFDIKLDSLMNDVFQYIDRHGSLYDRTCSMDEVTDYNVKVSRVRGNIKKDNDYENSTNTNSQIHSEDFFSLITKDDNLNKAGRDFPSQVKNLNEAQLRHHPVWAFENAEQQNNAITYMKTKFVRFLLSFYKTGQNIAEGELAIIPWMDFNKKWNDKELVEFFHVTDEQWAFIDNFIKDYYSDYDFEM